MTVSPVILALTRHRWNIPVLAHLAPRGAGSFGSILDSLPVSRDSLSRTLRSLGDPGWLRRKPDAWVLTPPGRKVARPCPDLVALARARGDLLYRKWTLPIVAALSGWELRFAELKAMLPAITPRALTLALKEMQAAGLVTRTVIGGFPPSTSYALTPGGEACRPALRRLC